MHNVMLPHELIDYIIDHLHDDRAALCACCLACKAWLACSRYHLFADVLLDYRRFDDIHSLPQPSTFAVATRRLMLAGTNILPPGIQHFSSITSFYLRVSTPTADMVTQIPLLFSNITLLELNQVTFDSFEQMFQTICRCTALETLTVFAGLWKEESEQLAPGLCLPPHLHTLNILSSWLHIFLDWFNTLESLPPLTTMRLCGIGEPHMASVGTAIKSLGNSLQHLTLDLRDHRSTDLLTDSLDLSHNPNLRSFTLINGWPKLLHRLIFPHTQARNAALEDLTLTIYEGKSNIPNLDLLDWSQLDHLVAGSRWLKSITLRIYAHSLISGVDQATVEGRFMPLAGVKGMVKFVSERERALGVRKRMKGPIALRSWGEDISS